MNLNINTADLTERVLLEAKYYIENKSTVRETADVFNISKSTVHVDLTKRLPSINKKLYFKVKKILEKNKSERAVRGGYAKKSKYEGAKYGRKAKRIN